MKNILLPLLLIFYCFTAVNAQVSFEIIGGESFTITDGDFTVPEPVLIEGSSTEFELVAKARVTNLGTETISITWDRISEDLNGDNCRSLVCDNVQCWSPSTFTNTLTLGPNESSVMDVHFQSNQASLGSCGGLVTLLIETPVGTIAAVYEAVTWAVGISETYQEEINVYPNPVRDQLNIDFNSFTNVTRVEIYNVIGKLVSVQDLYSSYYSVTVDTYNFEEGMYFINMFNERGEIVDTKVFSKVR